MEELARETDGLAEPVHHKRLELGAGGRGGPGEAEAVDPVRQHIAQQRGVAVQGGEVGVHVGALQQSAEQSRGVESSTCQ